MIVALWIALAITFLLNALAFFVVRDLIKMVKDLTEWRDANFVEDKRAALRAQSRHR